jgi:hypothetical protein
MQEARFIVGRLPPTNISSIESSPLPVTKGPNAQFCPDSFIHTREICIK